VNASNPVRYYVRASDTTAAGCKVCDAGVLGLTVGLAFAAVAALICVLTISRWLWRHRLMDEQRKTLLESWSAWGLTIKLKQVIGFYQVAVKIELVCRVTMPAEVHSLLNSIAILVSFGLDITTPLECFGASRYEQHLLFWLVTPLILALMIFAIGLLKEIASPSQAAESTRVALLTWAMPLVFKLMFLIYPIVNAKAFQAFPCFNFQSDGQWLEADVLVRCGSDEHERIRMWAWLAISVYPIGWTATIALLLFLARKSITNPKLQTGLSSALSFVYSEYKTSFFWWELLEMSRRFFLVGLLSIVNRGSITQLVVAVTFCSIYLALQLQLQPFKRLPDNYLALCGSLSLLMLYFGCVVLKYKSLTETEEVNEVLSSKLKLVFDVPIVLLSVIMVSAVLGSFAFLAALLPIQMRQERERLRRLANEAKARRLRYVDSQNEVEPPPLTGNRNFHVFLSHTWAQGEEAMRTVKDRLREMMPNLVVFLDKDDLKTGAGAEYIDMSSCVLCFVTTKYLESRACAREIFRAVLRAVQLFPVLEPDTSRGGLSVRQIRELLDAHYPPWGVSGAEAGSSVNVSWAEKWGLEIEVAKWAAEWNSELALPSVDAIHAALFESPAIEWNRFSAFQDVTMRLIAVQILKLAQAAGQFNVYVQGEVAAQEVKPVALTHGRKYHLYCSRSSKGSVELASELGALTSIQWTDQLDALVECDHFLLYLTSATWTSGEASAQFALEVCEAHRLGVHLLPVHEFPSMIDDADASQRGACAFNDFWNDDWTPKHLLKGDANVYRQIAIALKSDEWRKAGLVTVLDKMHGFDGERQVIQVDATTAGARRPTTQPQLTSPLTVTHRKSVQSPFSVHKLARKSSFFRTSLAERSHLADGMELSVSRGQPKAAHGVVPRTRKRISRMVEAPPSMRGVRKTPLKTSGSETFPQPQQLPGPVTAFCSRSDAPAASQASVSTSGAVEGRARGGSLAEEPSACWLPIRSSLSAPAASEPSSEPGADRAGGLSA